MLSVIFAGTSLWSIFLVMVPPVLMSALVCLVWCNLAWIVSTARTLYRSVAPPTAADVEQGEVSYLSCKSWSWVRSDVKEVTKKCLLNKKSCQV